MTGMSVLLLGVGLGLRHATDADHVVVVTALVQREESVWRAARIAVLWGIGHTATFLGLGVLIVFAGIRMPASFERLAELLVAVMLLGFGAWHLLKSRHAAVGQELPQTTRAYARPMLIGIVHGLAGSAGVALLTAVTIPSRALAAVYLALFSFGTLLGMVGLTTVIARPITWTMRREGVLRHALTTLAALSSMGLGALILARSVLGDHAP